MAVPRKPSPADMLTDIGRTLYGTHWRMALSRDVGVDDDTIRRWMSGRTELPPNHGVFRDALALLERRAGEIRQAADLLRQWQATHVTPAPAPAPASQAPPGSAARYSAS